MSILKDKRATPRDACTASRTVADDRITEEVAKLRQQRIRYVRFEFPDLHGMSRVKVVPIDKLESYARNGLNMYGGTVALDSASNVVPGTGIAEEVKYRDQLLIPDFDTLHVVPWLEDTARVICDSVWGPDEPIEVTPRNLLRRVLRRADEMGFDVMMAHEFEFYLFERDGLKPLFGGVHIFNVVRNNYTPFLQSLLDNLQAAGIDVLTHNAEYAPSQFETNFGPAIGIAAADKAFTFKNAVKELAHRAGLVATFMSKPAPNMAGCGCHVHVSLIDRASGKSVFYDPGNAKRLPDLLMHFVCGILEHGASTTALTSPTPNCYHRLKPGSFSPSNLSWGQEDRTAMVRLKQPGHPNAHVEMRAASGLSNPYISAAAVLAAGLLGLEAGRMPEAESVGLSEQDSSKARLPKSLEEALERIAADEAICDLLGRRFVEVFSAVKRFELARFRAHVSDWERNEYIEMH